MSAWVSRERRPSIVVQRIVSQWQIPLWSHRQCTDKLPPNQSQRIRCPALIDWSYFPNTAMASFQTTAHRADGGTESKARECNAATVVWCDGNLCRQVIRLLYNTETAVVEVIMINCWQQANVIHWFLVLADFTALLRKLYPSHHCLHQSIKRQLLLPSCVCVCDTLIGLIKKQVSDDTVFWKPNRPVAVFLIILFLSGFICTG